MFSLFNKDKELNHDILLLTVIVGKCNEFNGCWNTTVVSNEDWKSIRLLNKRGLIKYFKTEDKNVITITLTLFCLYLTKVKKYDIEKVYNEANKIYDLIGGEKNGICSGKVLLQR